MKYTIAVTIAAMLMSGCEAPEDGISPGSPFGPVEESKAASSACGGQIILVEEIPLRETGRNPIGFHHLEGSLTYSVSPSRTLPGDAFSVSLGFQASLRPANGTEPIWFFAAESKDQIAFNGSDPTILVKKYHSSEPSPLVTLYVRYEVTRCNISINSMWAVKNDFPAPSPTVQ